MVAVCSLLIVVSLYKILPFTKSHIVSSYNAIKSNGYESKGEAAKEIGEQIPQDGDVYFWTSQPRAYLYANHYPCIRYCGWQEHYMQLSPKIYDELEEIFKNSPPDYLVIDIEETNNLETLPKFLEECLLKSYEEGIRNDYFAQFFLR